ncbi:hypothetical protein LguiB_031613 [Lonicera macranthoides]
MKCLAVTKGTIKTSEEMKSSLLNFPPVYIKLRKTLGSVPLVRTFFGCCP